MKRCRLKRKTHLKSRGRLRRKKPWIHEKKSKAKWRNKHRRDWDRMGRESHENAGGECEWCGKPVELGTYPAHIIPRDINKPELDEAWNIACLCIECHNKFDLSRPRAIESMIAQGGRPLYWRIQKHPRLKAYFNKIMDRWKAIKKQMGGDGT